MAPGDRTGDPLVFTYESGLPFDYWWVTFVTVTGVTYTCKADFFCNVAQHDDGNVEVSLNLDKVNMTLEFSKSSGCAQKLFRVDGVRQRTTP